MKYRRENAIVKRVFEANCGDGARFLGSYLTLAPPMSQNHVPDLVAVQFEMVPEGRQFNLDGVVHKGQHFTAELEKAVIKIADIARDVRKHLAVGG